MLIAIISKWVSNMPKPKTLPNLSRLEASRHKLVGFVQDEDLPRVQCRVQYGGGVAVSVLHTGHSHPDLRKQPNQNTRPP